MLEGKRLFISATLVGISEGEEIDYICLLFPNGYMEFKRCCSLSKGVENEAKQS